MTTKKQRRAAVAAKRAARIEGDRVGGLNAQRIAREKREQRALDAERAAKNANTRAQETDRQIRALAEAKDMTVGEFLATAHAFENAVVRSGKMSYEEAMNTLEPHRFNG